MRGTHSHRSEGTYPTNHEKPCKHHGEPRRPHCKGTWPWQPPDEQILQNGWPKIFRADKQVIALVFVPAFCFAAVSVIRKLLHFPRPYDLYHFQPVIPREKKGDSFPSRHVFSIFLIATLWFGIFEPVGIFLFAAGIILALIRVFGGVHFPKDVLCGAAIGIICGILTLFICTL